MRYFLIALAVLYVLFPRDLIPDMAPIVGWLDDLLAIYLTWRFVIRPIIQGRQPAGTENYRTPKPPPGPEPHRSPHDVLGIPANASDTQIRDAYRKLAAQYHPDKVAHLGADFQRLAEQRFKEINAAYQTLTRSK